MIFIAGLLVVMGGATFEPGNSDMVVTESACSLLQTTVHRVAPQSAAALMRPSAGRKDRSHLLSRGTPDIRSACGIVVLAYGSVESKYIRSALATVERLLLMEPPKGWCEADPDLSRFPITLYTDRSPDEISNALGDAWSPMLRVDNNTGFEALDDEIVAPEWSRLGPPVYHWYHCQAFVHAPYDLFLFLDADATVCSTDSLVRLFRRVQDSGSDIAFMWSEWMGGYGMTGGNRSDPHPASVKSSEDMESWERLREPNNGAIFYSRRKAAAQLMANDFCAYLKESFHLPNVSGDQFGFREAFWKHKDQLKTLAFEDGGVDGFCRQTPGLGRCTAGCAIEHGWWRQAVKAGISRFAAKTG